MIPLKLSSCLVCTSKTLQAAQIATVWHTVGIVRFFFTVEQNEKQGAFTTEREVEHEIAA